jgi:hypothetical protein
VHRDEGCNGQSPAQKSISEERAAGVGNALQDVRRASLSRVLSPAACADRHQARIGRTKRLRQAVLHGRRIKPVLWDIPACVLTELGLRAGLRGVYLFAVTALRLPSQHGASAGFMRLRATRRDLPRYAINARNEGVRGSSPRVGSFHCASSSDERESVAGSRRTAQKPYRFPVDAQRMDRQPGFEAA